MILSKAYENRGFTKDELKLLIEFFFKVKNIKVNSHSVNLFVVYLTTLNENPMVLPKYHLFMTLSEIIHSILVPTIENHLEVLKFYNKEGQFIKYTWNDTRYKDLF